MPAAAHAWEIRPAEGAELSRVHVEFRWPPACDAWGYEIAIVPDDGSAAPFAQTGAVTTERLRGLEPRAVLTEGFEFGTAYAWRVRSLTGRRHGAKWGPTRRFSVRPLPELFPTWSVSEPATGPVQSGLTILDFIGFPALPGLLRAIAVDRAGQPVWFAHGVGASIDTRQLPDGLITWIDVDRGYAATLDGEVVWSSPADPSLQVHHELFPMPGGNFLAVVWDVRDVEIGGELVTVRGDRIVELDRDTNEVVWEWSTFDGYSLEDMPPPDAANGNWTHVNAAVYDPRTNSVNISSRNLSRITRIDYETREIVFNMGKAMPSGDVDFGDGLFRVQHAPEIQRNGNMLLHDNGILTDPVANKSRAIELAFDDRRHPTSASIVWEHVLPKHAPIVGDADRLPNGNTLIASGVRPGAVYEVTRDGDVVWQLDAVSPPLFFYRAERIDALVVRSRREQFEAWIDVLRHQAACHRGGPHGGWPSKPEPPQRDHPHRS